jgi:hypothetical protein
VSAGMFILPKDQPREKAIQRLLGFIGLLPAEKAWTIEVSQKRSKRSTQQNAYLWGVVYPTVLQAGGELLAGWVADDLHDYFLGEHFGWETLAGFGKKRLRPLRRSSKLTTMEFIAYLEFIQRRMAEQGIYIPDPNESVAA